MCVEIPEQAKLLIDAGADLNAKDKHGKTALMLHIRRMNRPHRISDKRDIIKMLIEAGADVNAKDKNDKTVFDYAIESQKYLNNQLVELEKSINIKKDRNEEPALILFLESDKNAINNSGIQDIIKMLIEAGAHVDTKYKNGQTVSDHAVKSQNHITELTKANTMLKHSEAMKGDITPKLANELIDKMKGARE
jgi:ankyrin repeat protein